MRYAAIAAAGLAAAGIVAQGGAARAASAQVWQGTVFIQSVTGACTTASVVAAGDYYTMVYRPIILPGQAGPEGLSFIGARTAQYWSTLSSGASFSNAAVANILTFSSHASSSYATSAGGYSLTILPTAIATNTPTVTMTGLLSNFWNVSGCNVTISAALTRRP